jgi:hypothetical protein
LPTILGSNCTLSTIDGQQVVAATAAAKRKEDDAMNVAQATTTTVHQEHEALVAAVAATCKTLDEARIRERVAALTWEKEKTIAHHLEQ